MWHGIKAKLSTISIGVNYHFYNIEKFTFSLFFIIQWTMLAALHAELLLWWSRFLEFYLLIFLSCFWFYWPLYVKLISCWWCFDSSCGDLSWIIYFSELLIMEARHFKAWKGFLKTNFKKLKMRCVIGCGFLFLCKMVMCVFGFFVIMVWERNVHNN
jgi:hypothetical protein